MSFAPTNPYAPPQADPNQLPSADGGASLENALAGRYDFTMGEVFKEAWQLTKGSKATVWGLVAVFNGGGILAYALLTGLVAVSAGESQLVSMLASVVGSGLMTGLSLPLLMLTIDRAAGRQVRFADGFAHLNRFIAGALTGLLVSLMTTLGMLLLIIPGIYLAFAYSFSLQLVGERGMSPWRAMETSRKAIGKKWFKVVGTFFCASLLLGLSALPLGIGLIWTVPWLYLLMGVLYKRIFGLRPGLAA